MDDIAYERPGGLWLADVQVAEPKKHGYDRGEWGLKHMGFFMRFWWFGVKGPEIPLGATLCGREFWLEGRNRKVYAVRAASLDVRDNLRVNCQICALRAADKDAGLRLFNRAADRRAKQGFVWADLPEDQAEQMRARGVRDWPATDNRKSAS